MKVWVEMGTGELTRGLVLRIFRNPIAAGAAGLDPTRLISTMEKAEAVGSIRTQVFNRACWHCERCGASLTFQTGQMHEKIPKGQGGEVSLANCQLLCYPCHQGRPDAEHGKRRPQWTSPTSKIR